MSSEIDEFAELVYSECKRNGGNVMEARRTIKARQLKEKIKAIKSKELRGAMLELLELVADV